MKLHERAGAARNRLSAAIATFHAEIAEIYPVGHRVKIVRGNRVRLGTVVGVSTHFVQVRFDGKKRPVWKDAIWAGLEDA